MTIIIQRKVSSNSKQRNRDGVELDDAVRETMRIPMKAGTLMSFTLSSRQKQDKLKKRHTKTLEGLITKVKVTFMVQKLTANLSHIMRRQKSQIKIRIAETPEIQIRGSNKMVVKKIGSSDKKIHKNTKIGKRIKNNTSKNILMLTSKTTKNRRTQRHFKIQILISSSEVEKQ